jgi:hypothetical protein
MTNHDEPVEPTLVECEVCLKEVPESEAVVPEASDYVVYFCGLECYQRWRALAQKDKGLPEPLA